VTSTPRANVPAGNPPCIVGGKEGGGIGDVVGLADAPQGREVGGEPAPTAESGAMAALLTGRSN